MAWINRVRTWLDRARALVLLALAALIVAMLVSRESSTQWVKGQADVIDGDSLRIAGREIRLEGIDAPEYHQTCREDGVETPCGRQARDRLAGMVGRGSIACAVDGHDRYGRDLAVCRVGELEINAAMVRQGAAVSFGRYDAEEAEARAAGRGIWATQFERPAAWRAGHPRGDH
jgi:endonuclease YncB( thermonuclease family)